MRRSFVAEGGALQTACVPDVEGSLGLEIVPLIDCKTKLFEYKKITTIRILLVICSLQFTNYPLPQKKTYSLLD